METGTQEHKLLKENRLAKEKSPYLLQHKNNPVDWYPWGEEAIERAKAENKPIFLSVGYSTCHWCHVMAHESFENEEIAAIMNKYFVNIKLDREERPDIDKVYMTFVQATQGGGGWPMSVFMTPELMPILSATYFPPKDQYGRKGFPSVCEMVQQSWEKNEEGILLQSRKMTSIVKDSVEESSGEQFELPEKKSLDTCFKQISRGYDEKEGGFGKAPKFPRPVIFDFLLRINDKLTVSLTMCEHTLKKMCNGGMYDHIGGGFHRYSVTKDWHIPHYEKMLYDQAQIITSLCETYQISQDPFFVTKAAETADYVLSKLTSPLGGFYCAEDADSLPSKDSKKTQEGAFYVWTTDKLRKLLGQDYTIFAYHYDVKEHGNAPPEGDPHGELENKNTLIARVGLEATASKFNKSTAEIEEILKRDLKILYKERETRPRPHLDDKIVVSWNGLMITALAKIYAVVKDDRYLTAAKKAVTFIKEKLYNPSKGTLIRNFRDGPSNTNAFTDDYAFLVQGLFDLYQVTLDPEILNWALTLHKKQLELFLDEKGGGFFICGNDDPNILLRMKEDYDGSEPSNNSISALNLLSVYYMFNDEKSKTHAEKLFKHFSGFLLNSPIALPKMCVALDWYYAENPRQIVFVGEKDDKNLMEMFEFVKSKFLPRTVVILLDKSSQSIFGNVSWLSSLPKPSNQNQSYVVLCSKFVSQDIATNLTELQHILH